ncbi:hypothetical protein M9Y10_028554 [Tritrichomonas musculus]|uniref:Uncharacterized protein n=1 Tax=Tritrichomonas musculus TaxID=1915356 RepID=A0ABR2KKJ8_9EUKA
MFDFNYPDDAKFTTKALPFRKVKGSEQLAKLDITPSWTPIWDFKSLAIFLNQCTNFKPIKPRANRIVSLISEKYREFKFECKILDSIYIMIVQVFPLRNFSINVFFGTNYVFTDDWKEIEERKFFLDIS